MTVPTSLYRHFAADGSLLYVGISLSWPARTKAHAREAQWFSEVARVTLEHFSTREEALQAERETIRRERPRFNVVHNRPRVIVKGAGKLAGKKREAGPLSYIKGPHALVGPALVYTEDAISIMVAWGTPGEPGELTELVLGELAPEVPAWADACASVLVMLKAGQITMEEARGLRLKVIRELVSRQITVAAFETDLALARACATRFPSDRWAQILREIQSESECV